MAPIDTKAALLQALISGESYGLELIERVHTCSNGSIKLLQGRVYPALRQLEAEGLVKSFDGPPLLERGGRPRRYYRITAEGRRVACSQAHAIAALLRPALGVAG
jgi:PadR family transcriptional regulator PadR